MARALKTLEKMRANPRDWRIEDIESIGKAPADKGLTIKGPGAATAPFGTRASPGF